MRRPNSKHPRLFSRTMRLAALASSSSGAFVWICWRFFRDRDKMKTNAMLMAVELYVAAMVVNRWRFIDNQGKSHVMNAEEAWSLPLPPRCILSTPLRGPSFRVLTFRRV